MRNATAMPKTPDLVGSAEACRILELLARSTLTRWAEDGTLTPIGKLPGKNGAFLFNRADVERLAVQRKAGAA